MNQKKKDDMLSAINHMINYANEKLKSDHDDQSYQLKKDLEILETKKRELEG